MDLAFSPGDNLMRMCPMDEESIMRKKESLPRIDPELIAPCGMNCAICSAYLAYKNKIPRTRGKFTHCAGCRPRNKQCAFLKKRCEDGLKLLHGKVEFCHQCNRFPCKCLSRLDARYRTQYGMSMIANLISIRENGIEAFVQQQYEQYRCERCGGLRSIHAKGKCFACDTVRTMKG
jgi:hypothetical protein